MVEIRANIVITGIICLTLLTLLLIYTGEAENEFLLLIVGAITFSMGVVIPAPKIDNKQGVLKW